MKNRMKTRRVLCAFLILALTATCIFTKDILRAEASQVDTSDLEDKRQDTLDKIKDIKADLNDAKKKISKLESSKSQPEKLYQQTG